jgi:hypothetical protein
LEVDAHAKSNKELQVKEANVPPLLVLPSNEILIDDPSPEKIALESEGAGQDAVEPSTETVPIVTSFWYILLLKITVYFATEEPERSTEIA